MHHLIRRFALPMGLAASMLAMSPAARAVDYSVDVPTATPYTLLSPFVHEAGAFTDTFTFVIPSGTAASFVWLLPYNPVDPSEALSNGLHSASLDLYKLDGTPTYVGGGVLPSVIGNNFDSTPEIASYYALLKSQGFDLKESLYWSGTLGAGTYTAVVSGLAGGPLGGAGAYAIKFSVPAVPEPASAGLALAGLAVAGLLGARRRQSSGA